MTERLEIVRLWLNVCVLSVVLAAPIFAPAAQGPTYDKVKASSPGQLSLSGRLPVIRRTPY